MAEKEKARMKDFLPVHLPRDEFAKKIGLGLPSSSLALIEGEEGSGRSVVSQRLTYGLLENGFSVTYISTELTLKDFINQMYSMKYHIGPYLINTRLKFIPVLPIVGDQMPRQGYLQTL
ncbi:MAG: ATPase domain-containing protein, partial [Candidatus Methanomethylophilaceae archaeon]